MFTHWGNRAWQQRAGGRNIQMDIMVSRHHAESVLERGENNYRKS
jgi:hypothetical protein